MSVDATQDVGMQMVFYKLDNVDVPNGHMRIKCWLRMSWFDYRLRWDPAEFGNITSTYFRAATFSDSGENSAVTDIWLPDVAVNKCAR